jgi:hypothetical protein
LDILRDDCANATLSCVDERIERRDIHAIMEGIFDANVKLDEILRYLYGEDDEEEETDSS